MSFESELAAGRFRVPECARCQAAVWPPSPRCAACLGPARLRAGEPAGVILERSRRDGRWFCVADFGGARVVASSASEPVVGQKARMASCGTSGGEWFFEVSPA